MLGAPLGTWRFLYVWPVFHIISACCVRYYYEAFISAAEEISLEEVVSRTAAALFLGPLRIAGKEFGHFFKEFYGEQASLQGQWQPEMTYILVGWLIISCLNHN